MKKQSISAAAFEEAFDRGDDILPYVDLSKATRPGLEPRRVSVDFPEWMVHDLDLLANKLGITRQSLIKVYIADRLKAEQG